MSSQTEIKLKPWDELSIVERKTAIALRLGWISFHFDPLTETLWGKKLGHTCPYVLPDWPTNDGLAFSEVWPKIVAADIAASLQLWADDPDRSTNHLPSCYSDKTEWVRTVTWAEAICRCAYELLPETA